jgi:molybdate transport system permease protein
MMFGLTDQARDALTLSLQVAGVATVCTLPLAVLTGLILARGRFWGHGALNLAVHLPLVLPPVVTGYLLLILFGRTGPVGAVLADWGIVLAFRWTGAALAAGVMAFPLMVRAIRLAIEAVDPGLEQAAGTLGAGRLRVFFTITLPLALPGVVAGAVLGFAKAVGEFGATITFVSNIPGQTQTLPTAIYVLLQAPGAEAQVALLVGLSVAVAVVALGLSEWLARRTAAYVGRRGHA